MRIRAFLMMLAVLVTAVACVRRETATCSGSQVHLVTRKTLTVGVDLAYPPFAFEDPKTREATGFEVDLVREIAKDLELEVSLVSRNSPALIPGLLAQRRDVVASGLIDSPELAEEVCLSMPYLDADLGLVTRAGDEAIQGTEDLDARVVGVVRGGRAQTWAKSDLGRSTRVVPFETSDDLLGAVREGRVDAVIDDLPKVHFGLRGAKDVAVVDVISTGRHYVLAAHPTNGALIGRIDNAIQKFELNGTLRKLKREWFGG